ncbi:uncharacterized protein LOC116839346 isoform X9 [Chelonoidis abingdonii]|uniref:uncharacterized protein LOC116839346 isoform X9 n=1 Tax=Chelonoidis abingdonii TaxID=106734 RepID=UPI0013F2AA4A|nr:uncharacterized protein LOC116839345 isoform X2 [Chelonoidis abingdonii]
MAAVCSLSKVKPPLALKLESRLLRALLYTIFTMSTGQDTTHFQALHNTSLQSLDAMLGCLLTETPTSDKLQHLLETSSDFPKAGNSVLQPGLYISDPANDISQQARSGICWLQRLLLQRTGKKPSWAMGPHRSESLGD